MKWFRHDSDAHSDTKLKRLRKRYGADGYALYWYCLELIAGKVTSTNIRFELEDDAELIADELNIDSRRVEEIMLWMVNQGLFEQSGDMITCLKMAKYMDERFTRDERLRSLIREQQGKPQLPDNPALTHEPSEDSLQTVCRLSGVTKPNLTKPNLTKVKNTRQRFTPPTAQQVSDYARSIGFALDGERFTDYYASNGWRVGRSPMKDWQAAVRTWRKNGGGNAAGRSGAGPDNSAAGQVRANIARDRAARSVERPDGNGLVVDGVVIRSQVG